MRIMGIDYGDASGAQVAVEAVTVYTLGSRLLKNGSSGADVNALQELLNQFRETVGLYALNGKRRVCVARLEGSRRLRSVVRIGESFSLTRGASGRVLLAYQPPEVVEECLREDPFDARQSREDIRRRGYAISRSERESGLISIAAPVFDAHGQVVASLFLTGADVHFDQKLIDLIAKTLVRFAWEISVKMGHNAPAPEL